MTRLAILPGLALLLAPVACAAACPHDRARYAIPGVDAYDLLLGRAAEPSAWSSLGLTLEAKDKHWDFSFTASNGYAFNYIVPAWKDAPEDATMHVFFFAGDNTTLDLPQANGEPPAFIFAPDLGAWLHYGETAGDLAPLPVAMWKFAGCR